MSFDSASERRTAIRVAQEHADRQRESTSISAGTLRAIAFDRGESTPASSSGGSASYPRESMTPPAFRPRMPRWVAPAGAVLLAASVLGATLFVRRGNVAPASPVPAATLGTAMPLARQLASNAPAAETLAPAPSAAAANDEREGTRATDGPADGHKPRGRNALHSGATKARIVTAPAGSAALSAQPTASQAASAPSASAPPAANAWDRQTFGGRF